MGKCLAGLLLTRTVNYRRPQSVLLQTPAYTVPTRPAIKAQTVAINSLRARHITSGAADVVRTLAASPPHKFSFRPNIEPRHAHSPSLSSSLPFARPSGQASPAARAVIGSFPSHSQLLPTASQQASSISSLHWAALIRPYACRGCVNYPHAAGHDGCLPGLRGPSEPSEAPLVLWIA